MVVVVVPTPARRPQVEVVTGLVRVEVVTGRGGCGRLGGAGGGDGRGCGNVHAFGIELTFHNEVSTSFFRRGFSAGKGRRSDLRVYLLARIECFFAISPYKLEASPGLLDTNGSGTVAWKPMKIKSKRQIMI